MRAKPLPVLLSAFLLLSCSSGMPKELSDYLSRCSLSEAESSVLSGRVTYQDEAVDADGKKVGAYDVLQEANFDFEGKKAFRFIAGTYSGTLKLYDESSQVYLTREDYSLSYDEGRQCYARTVKKEGYLAMDESGEKVSSEETTYLAELPAKSEAMSFFFTSDNAGTFVSGGVYYADFFKNHSRYYQYMSIQDGLFLYTLKNVAFGDFSASGKAGTGEKGAVDETIAMNEKGLLVRMDQALRNFTTGVSSTAHVEASYVYR
jgi:hypothetical protein